MAEKPRIWSEKRLVGVRRTPSFRHCLSDTLHPVLRLLADYIDCTAGDASKEVMEPESEDGTRVVQSKSWNEMLNLVIDADDNRDLAGAYVQDRFHLDHRCVNTTLD